MNLKFKNLKKCKIMIKNELGFKVRVAVDSRCYYLWFFVELNLEYQKFASSLSSFMLKTIFFNVSYF